MPHFFNLPESVRKQIYEYCLVVGEVDPFPTSHWWKPAGRTPVVRPAVTLLLVHPLIKAEARDILYGGNTWLMLNTPHGLKETSFWIGRGKQFRSVRTIFSQHDLIARDWIQEAPDRINGMESSRRARTEQLHNAYSKELYSDWQARIIWLMGSLFANLVRLCMDFHQCYCPIGCCRAVDRIIQDILRLFIYLSANPSPQSEENLKGFTTVELYGTGFESKDEKEQFWKAIEIIRSRDVKQAVAMLKQTAVRQVLRIAC